MLDPTYAAMIHSFEPEMNEDVMNGYVVKEMAKLEERVDEILRKAYDGLFGGRLRYKGFRACTPQEAFEFSTRPKNTRRSFELAQSDIYLVRISMTYMDHPLPDTFLYLPYFEMGGLMHISDALYHLTPVLSDKVISTEDHHIFVRLNQFKINFYEKPHTIVVNGEFERPGVAWGNVYKKTTTTKKRSISTKAGSCLVHYLLARLGFSGAFQRFAGFVPVVGDKDSITPALYPEDAWVIVKTGSERARPSDYLKVSYTPTKIYLAIPKDKWNLEVRALVAGFYYVVDHFPDKCVLEQLDHLNTWQLTLGMILFNNDYSVLKILALTQEHFVSSDTYMDDISSEKLAERGHDVKEFTELLALVAMKYHVFKQESNEGEAIYGRYLNTLQEVLHPITTAIFHHKYQLQKEGAKGPPDFNIVKDRLIRRFKPGPIFKLVSNKSQVAEIVSYSGDHMYLKITSRLAQQRSTPDTKSKKGRKVLGEAHFLTTAQMMVGSVLFLSKTNPVPLSHINPYVMVHPETGTVMENPKFKETLAHVDKLLARKG